MLRVFVVTAPELPAQLEPALAAHPLTEVYAPPSLLAAASALGAPHLLQGVAESHLDAGDSAIAFVEELTARLEGSVAVVVTEVVARAVVARALDVPVRRDRLAFDAGGVAEIEVRLDAPWTVNRLNDVCYEDTEPVT